MNTTSHVCAFLHQPRDFASRSGLYPLVEAVGAQPVFYEESWRVLQTRSWTAGQWLRNAGNWYYGSTWNSLVPLLDDYRLLRQVPRQFDVAHYLWGEFASPRRRGGMHRRARAVVGTFHASARRLDQVLKGFHSYAVYDWITLMSESQRPHFQAHGVPTDRLSVILHGVDTDYFRPAPRGEPDHSTPLSGLLVGSTERDHAFMADVLRALPPGVIELTVLTAYDQRVLNYPGVPHTVFPGFLREEQLLALYQQADLLVMPMLDCTANNAILEAMACGTPVLTNRVGGIPEYVAPSCNFILDGKDVDEWAGLLQRLQANKAELATRRPAVRAWVESFDWRLKAEEYHAMYRRCLESVRA